MSPWYGATSPPEASAPTHRPTSWLTFSVSVIAETRAAARSRGARLTSDQGPSDPGRVRSPTIALLAGSDMHPLPCDIEGFDIVPDIFESIATVRKIGVHVKIKGSLGEQQRDHDGGRCLSRRYFRPVDPVLEIQHQRTAGTGALRTRNGRPQDAVQQDPGQRAAQQDRKSTRLNSSHVAISYAVFCL